MYDVTKEKLLALLILFALPFSPVTSHAADPALKATARQVYQHERADCMSGLSSADKATCLREAGAALDEARQGELADPNTDFASNRIARCGYLKEPDKGYCLRRMNGEGTVSGSVESGGILRELVVIVPATESGN